MTPREERRPTEHGGGDGGSLHPFVQGLLATLPEPGASWPEQGRQKWLHTAENIFSLIYTDGEAESKQKREKT